MSDTVVPAGGIFFGKPHDHCGYCESKRPHRGPMVNAVMLPEQLSVRTYERLVFSGWRRSGTLLYAQKIPGDWCCPYYTIRLDAPAFRPSKSQRHVLAKWHRYLAREPAPEPPRPAETSPGETPHLSATREALARALCACIDALGGDVAGAGTGCAAVQANRPCQWAARGRFATAAAVALFHRSARLREQHRDVCALAGALQERLAGTEAVRATGLRVLALPSGHIGFFEPQGSPAKKTRTEATSVGAQQQDERVPGGPQRVPGAPPRVYTSRAVPSAFDAEEYALYRKYQTAVHRSAPDTLTEAGYTDFLVETPLVRAPLPGGAVLADGVDAFGSYHVQHRVDGRLVAVGVVDVLPHALSSVYCFYDPDLRATDLGTLVALREIAWVREAQRALPGLRHYAMGYYIHACQKMRYKARFHPSELLSWRSGTWVPLDDRRLALLDAGEAAGRPFVDLDPDAPSRTPMSRSRCAQLLRQCKFKFNASFPAMDSDILTEEGLDTIVDRCFPVFEHLGEWIFDGLCINLNLKL